MIPQEVIALLARQGLLGQPQNGMIDPAILKALAEAQKAKDVVNGTPVHNPNAKVRKPPATIGVRG